MTAEQPIHMRPRPKMWFVLSVTYNLMVDLLEHREAENRELRTALRNANAELRNARALLADLRNDPDATLKRIMGDHYGEKT